MVTMNNNGREEKRSEEKRREENFEQLVSSGVIYLLSKANQKYNLEDSLLPPEKEAEEIHKEHRERYTRGLSEEEREIFLTESDIASLTSYQKSLPHLIKGTKKISKLYTQFEISKADVKKRILRSKLGRISDNWLLKDLHSFERSLEELNEYRDPLNERRDPLNECHKALNECHRQSYEIAVFLRKEAAIKRIAILKEQNSARDALKRELKEHQLSFSEPTQTTMLQIALLEAQKKIFNPEYNIDISLDPKHDTAANELSSKQPRQFTPSVASEEDKEKLDPSGAALEKIKEDNEIDDDELYEAELDGTMDSIIANIISDSEAKKQAKQAVNKLSADLNKTKILAANLKMPRQSTIDPTVNNIVTKISEERYKALMAIENTYS